MFKFKFRDQYCGSFEKSLRQGSESTADIKQKEQGKNGGTEKGRKAVSKAGEKQENGGAMTEEKRSIFYAHEIKKIMDDILQEKLSNQTYDAQTCRTLCVSLSDDIKDRVKSLGMERFRLVCNVSIGSNSGQGFFMASRFLWDQFNDNFSTSCFQNASLFAVAVVFGVLKE